MSTDTIGRSVPAELRGLVVERAGAVDAGTEDPRRSLRDLGAAGLLTLGLQGSGTIAEQAGVLSELAEVCMTTAFCAWGHRMALEYLAVNDGSGALDDLADLRRIGSSAMAGAFKTAAGIVPLSVSGRREGSEVVLDGRIAWASNLHADAVALLAAEIEGEGPRIVTLPLETPGVSVRPARGLLALDATASGQLVLDGARVGTAAVSTEPFGQFIERVRRPFLVLQAAFCLGLARAALEAGGHGLSGLGAEFADDHADLTRRHERLTQTLLALADVPDSSARDLLELRLGAGVLAREAVRVEAAVTGGRGYLASSPTARRLREAAFLPIQSPTEAHLRFELRRLQP